jgi:hypothetical protein
MDAESDAGGRAVNHSDQSDSESRCDEESNAESFIYEDIGGKREAAWARDRRELEASKLSFLRTMKQQKQVDESVRLLLRRLEELPEQNLQNQFDNAGLDAKADEAVMDSGLLEPCSEIEQLLTGKKPQRIAAVAQLRRRGVDVAGIQCEVSDEASSEAATSPTKKAARTCFASPGAKRCTRPGKREIRKREKAVDHQRESQDTKLLTASSVTKQHSQPDVPLQMRHKAADTTPTPFTTPKTIGAKSSWSPPLVLESSGIKAQAELVSNPNSLSAPSTCSVTAERSPRFGKEAPNKEREFKTPQVKPSSQIREQSMVGSDPFSRWRGLTSPTSPETRDRSLGPCHVMVGEDWCGWTIQTSPDGELFYYHEGAGTSQWRTPRELLSILGEWIEVSDDSGNTYWANDLLNMSCWADPRCTANIFQGAYEGDMFFLKLYVYGNGNLNVIDSSGCTALHYACASSTEGVAAFLLENGASPDQADLTGGRPLHWACRYSHSEAARLLLEARADPDRQDAHGDSPLHLAAGVDCTSAVQWLINARSNPKLRTWKQGVLRSPAEVAVAAGAHNAAGMLREYEQELVWQTGQQQQPNNLCFGKVLDFEEPEAVGFRDRPAPVITRPASQEEDEVLSPVKAVARVARPLLRGVQWLANRMIPTDDTRSKCWELGRGTPVLESNGLSKFVASIPRGALEQIVQSQCFEDPPGFERCEGDAAVPDVKPLENA